MFRTSTLVLSLAILSLLFSSCKKDVDISEKNVAKIIKTLSSDEMKGRSAFRKEIGDAADFISGEFRSIGLQPLLGEQDYRQNFTLYSIEPEEATVVINNKKLDPEYYFGLIDKESLNWNNDKRDIQYISDSDEYRDAFKKFTSDDRSSLIVVSSTHSNLFHRYRSYLTRTNRTLKLDDKPNDVFILQDKKIRSFDIHFKNKIEKIGLFNVGGMIEGERKDEFVLFSAHYDHLGVIAPTEGDSIANGANDDASGVAGVIELARYFESREKPTRTLYFVAFTAEEVGGYGSQYFSTHTNPDNITAMFNIEMIGKPAVEGPNTAWITGFDYTDFGKILQNSVKDSSFVFYPDPYPNQRLFFRSDNATLARHGVPAHSISTTPIDVDQDYHKVSDEFNTLNIAHTTHTIQAIARAAEVIISGKATPTRISPEQLK